MAQSVKDLPTVNDAGLFVTPATYAHYLGIHHATVCRQWSPPRAGGVEGVHQ